MSKKYWLETYGCQMNMSESTALEQQLATYGWEAAKKAENADLAILNTCAVRKSAETRIWGRLGYLNSIRRGKMKIAVMGCMAERLKENLQKREPAVDIVVGNFSKQSFIDILKSENSLYEGELGVLDVDDQFHFAENHGRQNGASAFIPIMHGCNNFCTYCIVPYVRGREVSRPPKSIISEIQKQISDGINEITLLGQNVNSFSFEEDGQQIDFPTLLEMVCEKTAVKWLRFTSSHPKDFSLRLAEVIASNRQICNHLHLPLQHGSDKVLKMMNRKYTTASYMQSIKEVRELIPNIGLSTDLLIGFPGESEDDFNQTLSIIKEIQFDDAFTYYYNKRSGTKAATMEDQLEESVKKERLAKLIELQRSISEEKKLRELGEVVEVIVEKVSRKNELEWLSRSEKNRMVVFASDKVAVGDFCQVKLISLEGSTFKGEVV